MMTEAADKISVSPPPQAAPASTSGLGKLVLKYLPGQMLPSIIGFLGIPIVTRLLTPEQYGYYVLVFTMVTACNTMAFNWVASSALRFYRPMEDRKPALFLHLFAGLVLTALVLTAVAAISWYWLSARYRQTFLMVAPLTLLAAMVTMLSSTLRAQSRALAFSLTASLNALLRYVPGILALVLIARYVEWFVFGWTLGIALNVLLLIYLTGAWRGLLKARLDGAVIRDFLSYGMPILLVGLTNVVMSASDKFIIDVFHGEREVGLYGLGFQLGSMPIHLLGTTIMLAVFPRAIDAHEQKEDYSRIVRTGLRYLVLVITPVLAILAGLAPELLAVYSGKPEFAKAAPAMRLVLIALVLQTLAHYYRMPFMVHRRTGALVVIGVVAAVVGVAANLILVPSIGFVGSGWALLMAYATMLALSVVLSRRLVQSVWPTAPMLRSLAAAAVGCVLIVWLARRFVSIDNLAMLAAISMACMAVYAAALYLTGEIRPEIHVLLARFRARGRR